MSKLGKFIVLMCFNMIQWGVLGYALIWSTARPVGKGDFFHMYLIALLVVFLTLSVRWYYVLCFGGILLSYVPLALSITLTLGVIGSWVMARLGALGSNGAAHMAAFIARGCVGTLALVAMVATWKVLAKIQKEHQQ